MSSGDMDLVDGYWTISQSDEKTFNLFQDGEALVRGEKPKRDYHISFPAIEYDITSEQITEFEVIAKNKERMAVEKEKGTQSKLWGIVTGRVLKKAA